MLTIPARSLLRLVVVLAALPALLELVGQLDAGVAYAAPLASDAPANATVPGADATSFDAFLSSSDGLSLPLTARGPEASVESGNDVFMNLQQHINSARRKLARMEGESEPSDEDLHSALQKRRVWIADNWEAMERRNQADEEEMEQREHSLGAYLAASSGKMINFVRRKGNGSAALQARGGSGISKSVAQASQQHSVTDAPSVSADNTAGLSIEANDVGYFMTVKVGSNNDEYKMLLDSGSSDTWITGKKCSNCGSSDRNKLSKSSSSSLKLTHKKYKISYGTGSVSVTEGSDSMSIAGLQLTNFNFGVASKESGDFGGSNIPFDGLLGLAGKSLSTTGSDTPIEALVNQNKVDQPIVGYRLGRVADGDNKGQVTFGAVDNSQISGSLNQYDNQGNGYWKIKLSGVKVGGKSIDVSGSATLDTGTSLIVAPQDQADAIHNAISGAKSDGQGGYTLPCSTRTSVSFTFGGDTYTMDPRDLLFAPSGSSLKGTCVSSISSGSTNGGGWLLGAPFLKNVYFATNSQSNKVGLGNLN